ncbi:hypothetical protein [Alkalitalea saponilacus]|uniref:Uncharacterized protein n=1 Tax=Alkalitalea saponilacus TaxID=889453 RepID=A0A1T5HUC0_9BACT|nr:hypothetical protein [Alkalitalea saponilacus]ASB50289.1 hypothetical protein CDL62_14650 [Alkalitalea saponilacus]SKC24273.1 hypothetical protein SAMN03080601_03570 [Alkalitalea saponilacus]
MKRLKTLTGIALLFISLNLNAQFNDNEYFLIKNQRIENKNARRLLIKMISDSTYEFVDNINRIYKIDKKTKEIEFPLSHGLSNFSIIDNKIEIKTKEDTYVGTQLDFNSQQEKEFFKNLLIDLELPSSNQSDSIINSLKGITTIRNSETLFLSCHQKNLNPLYDKIGSCLIQLDESIISVCDIDNRCTMSGVYIQNKDLLFKNRMENYQLKEDFVYVLFIDKDVKIKDINTTVRAIRKIDNLSQIYFATKSIKDMEYVVNYISIPINIDLNENLATFSDWISANVKDRYVRGEKLNIVEDESETKIGGFVIVE